jgi:hypothetical protein
MTTHRLSLSAVAGQHAMFKLAGESGARAKESLLGLVRGRQARSRHSLLELLRDHGWLVLDADRTGEFDAVAMSGARTVAVLDARDPEARRRLPAPAQVKQLRWCEAAGMTGLLLVGPADLPRVPGVAVIEVEDPAPEAPQTVCLRDVVRESMR